MADEKVRTGGVAYGSYIRTSAANNILAYSELIHDDQFSAYTDTQNTFNNTDQHSINEYLLSLIGTGGNGSSVSYNQSTGVLTIDGETFTLKGISDDDKAKLDAITGSVYLYQGSKATYNNLPTEGVNAGDVYNVRDTGMNYAAIIELDWLKLKIITDTGDSFLLDFIDDDNIGTDSREIEDGYISPLGTLNYDGNQVPYYLIADSISGGLLVWVYPEGGQSFIPAECDYNGSFIFYGNTGVHDGFSYTVDSEETDRVYWDALGATVSNNPGTLTWQ